MRKNDRGRFKSAKYLHNLWPLQTKDTMDMQARSQPECTPLCLIMCAADCLSFSLHWPSNINPAITSQAVTPSHRQLRNENFCSRTNLMDVFLLAFQWSIPILLAPTACRNMTIRADIPSEAENSCDRLPSAFSNGRLLSCAAAYMCRHETSRRIA
jgi:hypothetical protein